LNFQGFFIL